MFKFSRFRISRFLFSRFGHGSRKSRKFGPRKNFPLYGIHNLADSGNTQTIAHTTVDILSHQREWLQYTLRFSWLHLLSSPHSVYQGWLLLPGGVQPLSDGHQSLQCTVVCNHPTVNVCQCIVGKSKCTASCQTFVNICPTWRMSTNTTIQTLCYLVG